MRVVHSTVVVVPDDPDYPVGTNEWNAEHTIEGVAPSSVTKEATGFADPAGVVATYDPSARTVTLSGTVSAYYQGSIVSALVPGWVSAAHDDVNGSWFLYWNGSAFVWQMTTPWAFSELMIAYVFYSAADKFSIRESHGLMQWQSHKELHQAIGTYFESGGDITAVVIGSTTVSDRRPAVSEARVSDEDLPSSINALSAGGPYTTLKLTSTGASTFATGYAEIVPVTGSNPAWNQFVTPNWVQTPMGNNSYMSLWLVAVPVAADAGSQLYRYMWVQGQSNGSLASEQAKVFNGLNLGQLATVATEFCPIGKVIIQYLGGDWKITSVEKITGTRVASITSPAGMYPALIPAEIDFGVKPVYAKSFTVAEATATTASRIQVSPSSETATGRVGNDDMEFDGLLMSASGNAGSINLNVVAVPGPVVGKRKIYYTVG